jgi:hypothetical protein
VRPRHFIVPAVLILIGVIGANKIREIPVIGPKIPTVG